MLGQGVVINRVKPKRLLIASGVSQESLPKIILLKVSAKGLGSGTDSTSAGFWVKLDQCGEHSISSGLGQSLRGCSKGWRYGFKRNFTTEKICSPGMEKE